jgi:hypothetical protein
MLVSNIVIEIISPFNPDQYFPNQINIYRFRSLATLNKKEFLVGGQGTAVFRKDHCSSPGGRTSLWGLHLHMVLTDLGRYDRFVTGHMGSI